MGSHFRLQITEWASFADLIIYSSQVLTAAAEPFSALDLRKRFDRLLRGRRDISSAMDARCAFRGNKRDKLGGRRTPCERFGNDFRRIRLANFGELRPPNEGGPGNRDGGRRTVQGNFDLKIDNQRI